MRPLIRLSGFLLLASIGCGDAPYAPGRYGVPLVIVDCHSWIGNQLACRARISCSLYACGPDVPDDVTTVAVWTVEDDGVAAIAGAGRIAAVAPGDTVVRATWRPGVAGQRSISVFPGTAPMPTFEISGGVFDGPTPPPNRIDGAVVEVLTGFIAGRRAVTGAPPDSRPGLVPFSIPGGYRIVGVPPGTYRVRVTGEGFVPQEGDAEVSVFGGAGPSFHLQRQ